MDSPSFPAGGSAPDPRAAEPAIAPPAPALDIDLNSLVTEDDEPVDMLAEKQHRLLTEPLYSFWAGPGGGRPFLVAAKRGRVPRTAQSGDRAGLRWTDARGELILTGKEAADQARRRAERERAHIANLRSRMGGARMGTDTDYSGRQ